VGTRTDDDIALYQAAYGAPWNGEALAGVLCAHGYQVRSLLALDVAPAPHSGSPAAALLVAVWGDVPSDRELDLVTAHAASNRGIVCAFVTPLADQTRARLATAGVLEIVELGGDGEPSRTARLLAGVGRAQVQRALAGSYMPASARRDVAAEFAMAGTPEEVLGAYARAAMALGAVGVACWEQTAEGVRLTLEVGASADGLGLRGLPSTADHPAARGFVDGDTRWFRAAADVAATYSAWRAPAEPGGAFAVVPIWRGTICTEVAILRYLRIPEQAERRAVQAVAVLFGATLRRTEQQAAAERERDALRRLVCVLGHDLRSPLGTISMAASIMVDALGTPAGELAGHIERVSRGAIRLVDDLLTCFSPGALGVRLQRERFDAADLLQRASSDAQLRARRDRRVELHRELDDPYVFGDPGRITQVVDNLLSNALAYSPAQSVVSVGVTGDSYAVYIDVENRGNSLDARQISEIFEPMKRLERVGERGSMGLGLFVVDRIMAAHGGQVWVEAGGSEGVRFCLQLPRQGGAARSFDILEEASTPSFRPRSFPEDPELAELARQFRAPALGDVLALWLAARQHAALPHPHSIAHSQLLPYLPDIAFSSVALVEGRPVFSWRRAGARLERRLARQLEGALNAEPAWSEQYLAYRRCFDARRPTYDYLRQRGKDPFLFERLLLPMASGRDGTPTDIMAVIVFTAPMEAREGAA
jgi:signal transduction histidine kinase